MLFPQSAELDWKRAISLSAMTAPTLLNVSRLNLVLISVLNVVDKDQNPHQTHFEIEEAINMFIRNVRIQLQDRILCQPRRPQREQPNNLKTYVV